MVQEPVEVAPGPFPREKWQVHIALLGVFERVGLDKREDLFPLTEALVREVDAWLTVAFNAGIDFMKSAGYEEEVKRLRDEVSSLCDQRDLLEARVYELTPPSDFDIGMQG